MLTIGFGRVNIPHPGHISLIEQCDIFVLSEGKVKNKLPADVRYDALVHMYPHIASKIVVGNIKEIFKQYKDAVVLCTEENTKFPQAFGMKTEVLEKHGGLSSTKIRSLIDNKDWQTLMRIYPSKVLLRTAIVLRNMEVSGIYV